MQARSASGQLWANFSPVSTKNAPNHPQMKLFTAACLVFAVLFFQKNLAAQTDPVRLLPRFDSMYIEGEAFFYTEKYQVILGGRHCNIDPEIEACDFNSDILILERTGQKRVWAVPIFNLPAEVADQFSAIGLCATSDEDGLAWVAGGYGFDDGVGTFSTIGRLTSFPLEKTVAALLHGQRVDANFFTINDPQLAVFDGRLMKIGDWFMLFGGQRTVPVFEENSDRPTHVNMVDLGGELRTWRLDCESTGTCELADFQRCEHAPTLFQCMPTQFYINKKTFPPLEISPENR